MEQTLCRCCGKPLTEDQDFFCDSKCAADLGNIAARAGRCAPAYNAAMIERHQWPLLHQIAA